MEGAHTAIMGPKCNTLSPVTQLQILSVRAGGLRLSIDKLTKLYMAHGADIGSHFGYTACTVENGGLGRESSNEALRFGHSQQSGWVSQVSARCAYVTSVWLSICVCRFTTTGCCKVLFILQAQRPS